MTRENKMIQAWLNEQCLVAKIGPEDERLKVRLKKDCFDKIAEQREQTSKQFQAVLSQNNYKGTEALECSQLVEIPCDSA